MALIFYLINSNDCHLFLGGGGGGGVSYLGRLLLLGLGSSGLDIGTPLGISVLGAIFFLLIKFNLYYIRLQNIGQNSVSPFLLAS